jgi:hypothetical protein
VVSPARLQANSSEALVYVAQALGGGGWAKVMGRRVFSNVWDALLVGILPIAAAGFLIWIIYKSLQAAPASQIWSVVGIVAVGVILMFVARFVLRSPFFRIPLESASKDA